MTVKTQNGNVILKNGKVSCSCCGGPPGPGECCMYPAQALADGLYSADDLPDAITGEGGTNFTRSGTTFLGPPNSYDVVLSINLSGQAQWASATNYANLPFFDVGFIGQECTSNCLITPEQDLGQFCYSYEDQFADTYTVTAGPYSATVSRIDICNWIGTDSCGNDASLSYVSGNPYTEPFKWFASIYFGPCDDPGTAPLPGYKEGNQNTPIGEYQNGLTVS